MKKLWLAGLDEKYKSSPDFIGRLTKLVLACAAKRGYQLVEKPEGAHVCINIPDLQSSPCYGSERTVHVPLPVSPLGYLYGASVFASIKETWARNGGSSASRSRFLENPDWSLDYIFSSSVETLSIFHGVRAEYLEQLDGSTERVVRFDVAKHSKESTILSLDISTPYAKGAFGHVTPLDYWEGYSTKPISEKRAEPQVEGSYVLAMGTTYPSDNLIMAVLGTPSHLPLCLVILNSSMSDPEYLKTLLQVALSAKRDAPIYLFMDPSIKIQGLESNDTVQVMNFGHGTYSHFYLSCLIHYAEVILDTSIGSEIAQPWIIEAMGAQKKILKAPDPRTGVDVRWHNIQLSQIDKIQPSEKPFFCKATTVEKHLFDD